MCGDWLTVFAKMFAMSLLRCILLLSSFIGIVRSPAVDDDIREMLAQMKGRKAEREGREAEKLAAENLRLQDVVPAVANGTSCNLDFPLVPADIGGRTLADESHASHNWAQLVVDAIWKDSRLSGFTELAPEELAALNVKATHEKECRPSTFGESLENYDKVFADDRFALSPEDVYVDLGGGVGKATLYASLKYNLARSVSVELSETRFDRSCKALRRFQDLIASGDAPCGERCRARLASLGRIEMVHEDMLKADLTQASVVTMWAACLPNEIISEVFMKLLRELAPGARVYERGEKFTGTRVAYGKELRFLGSIGGGSAYRIEVDEGELQSVEL